MDDQKRLYVGNLPYTVTTEELKNLFASYGDIEDAIVITDKMTRRSKGFGFITFANAEVAAKAAGEMNGKDIDGRKLVVNIARPMKPRE